MEQLRLPSSARCLDPARRLPRLLVRGLLVLGTALLVLPAMAVDVSPHAFATETPVDYYRNATQVELVSCSQAVQAKRKHSRPAGDSEGGCIAGAQEACRRDFEAALQAVRKPDAREALKAYHSAFMAALNGIAPEQGEPLDGYLRRQQALQHLLAHAWTRFELAE